MSDAERQCFYVWHQDEGDSDTDPVHFSTYEFETPERAAEEHVDACLGFDEFVDEEYEVSVWTRLVDGGPVRAFRVYLNRETTVGHVAAA